MEKQGLIRKGPHPRKKNQVVIRLTEKGKRLLAVSQERDSAARVMARLSPQVRAKLLSGLLEFRQSLLQELAENYRAFHFETSES
jgi:DNA-binding MarR family transcriptional regulator